MTQPVPEEVSEFLSGSRSVRELLKTVTEDLSETNARNEKTTSALFRLQLEVDSLRQQLKQQKHEAQARERALERALRGSQTEAAALRRRRAELTVRR